MTLQVFPLISNGDHTRDLYARFKTSEVLDQASFLPPFVLTDSHLLLICTGGEADIRIGHRLNHATLGKMYLILPGTAIEYTTDEVHPLQGIAIYFDMLKPLSEINKATSGSTVMEIYQKDYFVRRMPMSYRMNFFRNVPELPHSSMNASLYLKKIVHFVFRL